jgi:NAD(P)-dependent dehydrogenase (short-subunit alcohol dehydrogenase family)
VPLTGKTVLLTGGNSGIGRAAAAELARRRARVVITARDRARGEEAAAQIRRSAGWTQIDVADLDLARLSSVRACAERFLDDHDRLDVLVLNAGGMQARRQVTEDGFELTFQSNHLGHFLLTRLLLDRLKESAPARVVVVSSVIHRRAAALDFDDLQAERGYRGLQVYARAKLANLLFARELARRLEGTGVTVNALHPGTVRTGWGGDGDAGLLLRIGLKLARPFFLSPERGARTLVRLAASPALESQTGGYYVRGRLRTPAPVGRDGEAARRLWERSSEMVGLPA